MAKDNDCLNWFKIVDECPAMVWFLYSQSRAMPSYSVCLQWVGVCDKYLSY